MADLTREEMKRLYLIRYGKYGGYSKSAVGNPEVGDIAIVADGMYMGKCTFSGTYTCNVDLLYIGEKIAEVLYEDGEQYHYGFKYYEENTTIKVVCRDGNFIKNYYNRDNELIDTREFDLNEITFKPSVAIFEYTNNSIPSQ